MSRSARKNDPDLDVLAGINKSLDIKELHTHGVDEHEGRRQSIASNQDGQTMVEYGIILTFVALVATAAFTTFGQAIGAMFGPIIRAVT